MKDESFNKILEKLDEAMGGNWTDFAAEEQTDPQAKALMERLNTLFSIWGGQREAFQRTIQESTERLSNIMESAPAGICITNKDGIFEYVNPAYCEFYGYEKDELLGNHFTMVVPELDRPRLDHLHNEFMGKRWELAGQWRVLRKDGTKKEILANAAYIIDVDGRPKKVTYVMDISDLKKVQKDLNETVEQLHSEIELRKQYDVQRKDAERILRHDLRAPLATLIGTSRLFLEDESLDSHSRELAGFMVESSERMLRMIGSYLDIAHMESGTYQLRPAKIDLMELTWRVIRELASLSQVAGVQVDFDSSSVTGDVFCYGERIHLETLLDNLLKNAIEASAPGDTVHIRLHQLKDRVNLQIQNQGVIDPSFQERFFDRYSTGGKEGGTGLGTYISKLIVEAHQGSIDFQSSPDVGTVLSVILPVNPGAPLASHSKMGQ